jgi:cytochrome c-type biogenesis protein CcmF
VAAAAVVFVGTIFPALTEAFRGVKINVGPPYYNLVMVPIAVGILLLMGIGPLLPWRQATPEQLARNFMSPASAAVLGGLMLALLRIRDPAALLVFVMAVFVLATIVLEFARGTRARMQRGESLLVALARLVLRNRRRYGGYVVHLGILLMLVGIAASSAFDTQGHATLRPGERFALGRYTFEYGGLTAWSVPGVEITEAAVRVWADARSLGTYTPQRLFYTTAGQPMHHVAIRSSAREDVYLILAEWTADQRATIRVLIHPMVSWLWAGGVVLALGALCAALPERRRRTS